MLPGYASPVYWMLFPIVAAFLMAGPLTCTMNLIRKPGSTLLLPILFFLLAKVTGEMKFASCWIPYVCVVAGVIVAASISERLTEKIAKVES